MTNKTTTEYFIIEVLIDAGGVLPAAEILSRTLVLLARPPIEGGCGLTGEAARHAAQTGLEALRQRGELYSAKGGIAYDDWGARAGG